MLIKRLFRMPQGVFYGWKVLAAAAWMRALAGGFHSFAFTILFLPVARDLGLSRTAASVIFALSRAEGALEGPPAGYVIDRFGARVVMFFGTLIVGVGYILLSQAVDFTSFVLVYILVIGVGFGSAFMHSAGALVNHWFFRHRALALAVISASMSLGGAAFAPLFGYIVHQFGWRTAVIVSGGVFLLLGLPVTKIIVSTPEEKGLSPLGAPGSYGSMNPSAHSANGGYDQEFSVRQAMRTAGFWLLVLGSFLRMAGFSAIVIHFVPILAWRGIAEQSAAYYLGFMALFSVPTAITLGLAGDRWPRPRVLTLGMALGAGGLLFLLFGGERSQFLFIPGLAVVEALFPVIWATLGDLFGRKNFATIRGYVTLFATTGSMIGPVFSGMVFDRTGGYTLVIQVSIVAFVLSTIIFWWLSRLRRGQM